MINQSLRDSLSNYFLAHGFIIEPKDISYLIGNGSSETKDAFDFLIDQSSKLENPLNIKTSYESLVNFVEQVPGIQNLQLKPLLFAFFFYSVIDLFDNKLEKEAKEFFEKYQYDKNGNKMFHVFHDNDLKKLNSYLRSSSFIKQQDDLKNIVFTTSLTETTYQALVAFLMDKSYSKFIKILSQKVKINFVSFDHFISRPDLIPGFIFYSADQSEKTIEPMIHLLKDSPVELAKKYLGTNCTFEYFDDDHNNVDRIFPLPNITHDRVLAVANDIQNMIPLSKNNLPSCAYFTFYQENIAYDINGNGTLIAAATDRNYVKLISTNVSVDLDDNLLFHQIESKNNHFMIPRSINPSTNTEFTYTRTIVGPRTYCLRFSPDSKFLLCGQQSSIKISPCESAIGFASIPTSCGITWCVDWSPLGYHFVSGSDDSVAYLWSPDRSKPIRVFVNHQEPIIDIKYHPNASTIATASYDCSVMIWDIRCQSNSPFTKMFAETVNVPRAIQFTRNGRILIRGDESGTISTWDIGEGRRIGSIQGHNSDIIDMTISAEGTILATTSLTGEVNIWDLGTLCSTPGGAEPLKSFKPRNSNTHRISFSTRNLLHAIGTSKITHS